MWLNRAAGYDTRPDILDKPVSGYSGYPPTTQHENGCSPTRLTLGLPNVIKLSSVTVVQTRKGLSMVPVSQLFTLMAKEG